MVLRYISIALVSATATFGLVIAFGDDYFFPENFLVILVQEKACSIRRAELRTRQYTVHFDQPEPQPRLIPSEHPTLIVPADGEKEYVLLVEFTDCPTARGDPIAIAPGQVFYVNFDGRSANWRRKF